ncbi:histidine kinase [Paraflavisolibacter sp. H34]|uniref:sensor histidine kinase n=1 Tax=Huijunlia imazamoxiresistens TaxID=3127457 RepID=UPI003017076E
MNAPFRIHRFRLLFAACWLLWMVLHVQVLHWYGFAYPLALLDSVVGNGLLAGACLLVSTILGYYLPRQQRYGFYLGLVGMLALLWLLLSRSLLMLLTLNVADYAYFFSQSLPVRLAIGFLVIGSMTLLSVLWYTLQEQQEAEQRKAEAERLARDAELYKLRQQLQPHFLFNSLNSINALIGLRPQQARTMIQQLSDFLRGTLKKDEAQWVSLDEELQHLQLYLDIEKVRFGHRLATVIERPEGGTAMLPALLLQPIVENAIKFGLYDTLGDITITVRAALENNLLVLTVQNPFDPATTLPRQGTGFGLSSVQRRLFLLFARNDLFRTEARDHQFFTTIKIPQKG